MGGVSAPFQNIGEVKNTGWELDLKYQDSFGDVNVFGGLNLSHIENEVTEYGGIESIEDNAITKEGLPIGSYYAYVAEGYYQYQEELDAAPQQFGNPLRLGDIEYVDISGPNGEPDGKISADYDRQVLAILFLNIPIHLVWAPILRGLMSMLFFRE